MKKKKLKAANLKWKKKTQKSKSRFQMTKITQKVIKAAQYGGHILFTFTFKAYFTFL